MRARVIWREDALLPAHDLNENPAGKSGRAFLTKMQEAYGQTQTRLNRQA
jgi:hypothetical protein